MLLKAGIWNYFAVRANVHQVANSSDSWSNWAPLPVLPTTSSAKRSREAWFRTWGVMMLSLSFDLFYFRRRHLKGKKIGDLYFCKGKGGSFTRSRFLIEILKGYFEKNSLSWSKRDWIREMWNFSWESRTVISIRRQVGSITEQCQPLLTLQSFLKEK